MRAALYARVSTKDQNAETQLLDLRKYAASRGLEVIAELSDVGVSGSKSSRPGLDALMGLARARKLDLVVVAAFDRFGRSLSHLVRSLEEFQALGVGFVSLRDSVDLSTPAGKLMFSIIAAIGEFERSLIIERVNAGMRRARTQGTTSGKPIGRPFKVWDRDLARKMRAGGFSVRQIAAQLGVPSATVQRATKDLASQKPLVHRGATVQPPQLRATPLQ